MKNDRITGKRSQPASKCYVHVNSDGGFWEKHSFRLAGVANERTNSGHAQREREALS